MRNNIIFEIIACECMSLDHLFSLTCYPPFLKKEDDVIYLNFLISPYRNNIFPPLWELKDFFNKEDREYTPLSKKYWENYYRFSIWSRFSLATLYVFNKLTDDYALFSDVGVHTEKDLNRIECVLSFLPDAEKSILLNKTSYELEGREYKIKFSIEKYDDNRIPWNLELYIQFKNAPLLKRIHQSLKYIFGTRGSTYGDEENFEITPEDAKNIKYLIAEIKKYNQQLFQLEKINQRKIKKVETEGIKNEKSKNNQ